MNKLSFTEELKNSGFEKSEMFADAYLYLSTKELEQLSVSEHHVVGHNNVLKQNLMAIEIRDWMDIDEVKAVEVFKKYSALFEENFSSFATKFMLDENTGTCSFEFEGEKILLKDENFLAHLYKFASEVKYIIKT